MKKRDDLQRLAELRTMRLDRAVRALSEQSVAVAIAGRRADAATAAAVQNGERREAREGALFERLSMRPLTPHEIGRAHDALTSMETEAEALDRAEQDALRALQGERDKRGAMAAERLRLERERDKLETFARRRAAVFARKSELSAEADADDDPRPNGLGPRRRVVL